MNKVKLIINYKDDWQILKIDDKVIYENHRISAREALDYLQDHGIIDLEVEVKG